jgi:hypothetical protein
MEDLRTLRCRLSEDVYSDARSAAGEDLVDLFTGIQQSLDGSISVVDQIIAECREHAETQDSPCVMSPSELKEIFESFADRLSSIVGDRRVE